MDECSGGGLPGWLDLVHESVVITDARGRILAWNVAAGQLYGYHRDDVLGQDLDARLKTQFPDGVAPAGAVAWQGEVRRTRADGRELVVELRRAPHADRNGIVETGLDLTEARRTQAALRHSEYRYRNLFHAMAASFWELDFSEVGKMLRQLAASGVRDLPAHFTAHPEFVRAMMRATHVLDINEQTLALFGRGDKTELLRDVEPFWPESSNEVYAQSVIAAIGGAPRFVADTRLRRIDGTEFDAIFTACFAPDAVGRAKLLIGVLDISERKRAFLELQRMQHDLAHAARVSTLGELTASIAHEVNQPLAAITMNGEAGLRWLDRPQPNLEEIRELMHCMIADAGRAAAIIGRVRAMSVRRPPVPDLIVLNDVVREAIRFLHHEIQAHQIDLQLDLAPALPAVCADRIQLQQVIVNLAVNAMQAMSQSASMPRVLSIRSRGEGDGRLLVQVEDSGPGIAPTTFSRLFESFFSTKANGMGLGLPVCRSIVEAHGGELRVSNRAPAPGACVAFLLPAATP